MSPARRSLLVTGASGYLGSHLVEAASDWEVFGTYHRNRPTPPRPDQIFQLDLRDPAATQALFHRLQPGAVIHTALANNSPEESDAIPCAAENVAAAAREVGARLIHVSTDLIWDGEHGPYAASAPPSPIHPYGRAKAEAEAIVRELCPGAAIVRPSLIWGLAPLDKQTSWLVEGLRHGERVVLFTDEFRQPIYVRSLVPALFELAANDLAGPLNAGGAQRLSRWEFGLRLLAALRRLRPGLLEGSVQPVPGLVRDSGLVRARDLAMQMDDTYRALSSRLPGVDEVLAAL